ncbi:MAG: DUF503 domain-containing protein [Desulfarculus sp.]|nr:DUF503 domain-containing protein [Desulfarculus sp.]
MVVGALMMTLHVQGASDLKAKRKVTRSVIDRVRAKFNAAASELGSGDLWQRLELGFAVCSNEVAHAQRQLDEIGRFVERLALAEVVDVRQEVLSLKDMAWAPAVKPPWEA